MNHKKELLKSLWVVGFQMDLNATRSPGIATHDSSGPELPGRIFGVWFRAYLDPPKDVE